MTQPIVDFVEHWIVEHINAQPYVTGIQDARPKELAEQCVVDAVAAGIPKAEIDKTRPWLEERMASAINAAADAKVDRLASKDRS
jgi:hypothetical protein